jgi:uncharacterized membrane protein
VSAAADGSPPPVTGWERLDRAGSGILASLGEWRRRALKAEAEIVALRSVLEQVVSGIDAAPGSPEELRRLRGENAVLKSRADEARRRVEGVLARLAVVEEANEP